MNNKEKCIAILNAFTETQLEYIAVMLQAAHDAIDDAAENAYCDALLESSLNDPDAHEMISFEEFVAELGIDSEHPH